MERQTRGRDLWSENPGVFFYASSFTYGSFIHSMLKPALGARFLPVESACCSLRVVVEVVLLDVLNRGIAVVADGGDGNATLKRKGDPGMAERVPGQGFAAFDIDLSTVVAVVFGPGGKTGLHQHLLQSVSPDPGAQRCSGLLVGEQQIALTLWARDLT